MQLNYKKLHRYLVDFILLIVTSYFVLTKTTTFSISTFIKSVFQPNAGGVILNILLIFVVYALLARLLIYTYDYFKQLDIPNLCFPHYRCLLNNNKEIEKHIKELKDGKLELDKIHEKHSYEENIQIIHRNFSEHLMSTLKGKKLEARDIFLSLFHDKEFDFNFENISTFHYSSHYDPTIYETSTSELDIKNQKYDCFAGVQAIKKKSPVICDKINKNTYKIGKEERRQSIKHYFGIPLKINGSVVGLLNIEFHNKNVFSTTEEMKAFYQKEIQAFTYLYEYQIHKKYFFRYLKGKVVMA